MKIWMMMEFSELLRRTDILLLESWELRISSDKKYQVLLPNVRKLVLLSEWLQVTIKSQLWL
jgi:hypothetical protein